MDPYRTRFRPEPEKLSDNPVRAMGLICAMEVTEGGPVDVFPDFDSGKSMISSNEKAARSAFIADLCGIGVMLVPTGLFKSGRISERWVLAGGNISKRLLKGVMNDLLRLRDGSWVFLMERPKGEKKWPTMEACLVGKALLDSFEFGEKHDSGQTS